MKSETRLTSDLEQLADELVKTWVASGKMSYEMRASRDQIVRTFESFLTRSISSFEEIGLQ